MKRILVWFLILSCSVAAARAQDDATQQQINQLNGHVQDLLEAQDVQAKRIDALEKEINDLRENRAAPAWTKAIWRNSPTRSRKLTRNGRRTGS